MDLQQTNEATHRLVQLLEMQEAFFRNMSSQQRDRIVQEHLAAARSPGKRLAALCDMTSLVLSLRSSIRREVRDVGK